jgi:hypothetical protein
MFAEPLRRFSPDDKMQDNTVPHFATQLRARRIEKLSGVSAISLSGQPTRRPA